jgi:hypothetical protein
VPFFRADASAADGAKTYTFQRYGDRNNLISISINPAALFLDVCQLIVDKASAALKSATIDLDLNSKACLCVLKDIDNSFPIVGGGWISLVELDDSPQVLVEKKPRKLSLLGCQRDLLKDDTLLATSSSRTLAIFIDGNALSSVSLVMIVSQQLRSH